MEIAKRRADIDIEVAKDVAKIKSDETVAKAFVKSRIENVRTAVSGVKSAEKKVKVIQKALAKAKKEGRATTRISQVLAKAKSDLKTANTTKRSADSALNKAKKSIPTDTKVKITQAKAKADIRKAELLEESKKSVAEAKASLRDIQSSTKTSAPSARQTERLQNKIDKLEGKKAKLVEAYGSIDEVPASKIKEIDDAITELGNVTKINIDSLAKSSDPVGDFSVARGLDDVKVQETLNDVLKWISTGARGQLDKTIIESIDSLNIRPNDSVTLYRIGKVDDTEFQSWSRIKPPEGTEFTEKTFTPDKVLIDTTAPEMQILYREDAEALRVLQGFNKTEAEVMIKPKSLITTKEVTGGKITPVKIDGTDTSISTLMNRLNDGLKNVPESPEFNVATHAKQTENALDHIAKNGINETLSLIEKGEFPTNTTKASMVSALMESIEAVNDSALKLNYTDRLAAYIPELSEFATRAGQEIEALKVLHRDNPVMKIMRIQKHLNSKKALKSVDSEVTKLEKQLSKVDTKGIIKEAIDKFTC